MPVLNGWGFLKSFECLDSHVKNHYKIIVSRSSTDSKDIKNALEFESVKKYIPKPLMHFWIFYVDLGWRN